ncbi:hypothetical protein PUNSTDRAFT_146674 [Punctularia strigosozonata HHB-11173 SS5]|uniref:P-loop containing nucleoside triphosphate hydrolase protein n=1 Tax=Punctularia strigosozonata (strain HHB-11173) TaxID=741275 RepID=R7S319_PUNST|nr:uncharacterized protein PUNSTDRAFT_146674 [Punctularia strigosozonata HHB-11173 SS5]EIN04192.1 hypothetical protein PUNSTDRAFT_146674 [Punctularia strigosozonata HHB-11173 SS5]
MSTVWLRIWRWRHAFWFFFRARLEVARNPRKDCLRIFNLYCMSRRGVENPAQKTLDVQSNGNTKTFSGLFSPNNDCETDSSLGSHLEELADEMSSDDFVMTETVVISTSAYALKRKELMELTRDLFAMGAQTLIDLPRIAVIGGQSAGKSSLVEAVSGINVPRDSGTCTRCPVECSLIGNAAEWSCQIFLRFDFDKDGQALSQPTKFEFSPRLTDKADVEIWIRRAQAAILSPHHDHRIFQARTAQEIRDLLKTDPNMLKFSRNIVCVNIMDPDATDLSFVDLPGLIQNETEAAIKLVRELVEVNIRGESTLILVTIPASDDMENQQAVRLAREADPQGKRIIGILTKPDTLTKGATSARQKWKAVLEGTAHPLKHGYYCVRLPDDDERNRGIGRDEAEKIASEFFDSTDPWDEIIGNQRTRFGVPNFIFNMSNLLMGVIESALPKLKADVNRLSLENLALRARLPLQLTSDPAAELLRMITGFCADVRSIVYGEKQDDMRLVQSNRALYAIFKKAVRATAPDFRPFEDHTRYRLPLLKGEPEFDDEYVMRDAGVRVMNLWTVRGVVQQSIGWELKNNVPFAAKKTLIQGFTALWNTPAIACFKAVYAGLVNTVQMLIEKYFGTFDRLRDRISVAVERQIVECRGAANQALLSLLKLENAPLFTQNDYYFEDARCKWLAHYHEVRRDRHIHLQRAALAKAQAETPYSTDEEDEDEDTSVFAGVKGESSDQSALRALAMRGYGGIKLSNLKCLHPQEDFENELVVMADVRAYFQVAYKRIIDYVPLAIEHALNQAFAEGLQDQLFANLDFTSEDASERFKELMSENPIVAAKRRELEDKRRRLADIQRKLNEFKI